MDHISTFLNPINNIINIQILYVVNLYLDVIGVCVQIESEKTVNIQSQTCRWGKIKIDSTEVRK